MGCSEGKVKPMCHDSEMEGAHNVDAAACTCNCSVGIAGGAGANRLRRVRGGGACAAVDGVPSRRISILIGRPVM